MRKQCSIKGCQHKHQARGWCNKHYKRWRSNGDPLKVQTTRGLSPAEYFQLKTEWRGECLIWTGTKNHDGYGHIPIIGKSTEKAHRYAWEQVHGPIPEGLLVDHKDHCHPACCNVEHLRLASASQNASNRSGPTRNNTSGYRNVYRHNKKWRVQIKSRGVLHLFGVYDDIEEAARVAKKAREEMFGEYAGRGDTTARDALEGVPA